MANLTATQINSLLDDFVQLYVKALGTSASTYGIGPNGGGFGAAAQVTALQAAVAAMNDIQIEAALAPSFKALGTAVDAVTYSAGICSPSLSAIQSFVTSFGLSGVTSLDQFLTYLNTGAGGPLAALQNPNWLQLSQAWQSGNKASIQNLYFEVLQGATYANALGSFAFGGSYTAGFAIDQTKYAGGFPYATITGTPGTGTITVTGTAFNPATGLFVTGVTWTLAVTAAGTFALTAGTAPANSLIAATSNISLGTLTGGTVYIEAHRPAGRPLIS